MANPIWKDYYVDFGDLDSIIYRISYEEDGEQKVIFVGKANWRPGTESNRVRINDICADYLKTEVPDFFVESAVTMNTYPEFLVEYFNEGDGTWEDVEAVLFTPDWSYETPSPLVMADPIRKTIDRRQTFLHSVFLKRNISYTFTGLHPITRNVDVNGSGTISLQNFPIQAAGISIEGMGYRLVNTCAEWVVYYVNAYGGWDSFIIEGNVTERDDLKRYNISTEYNNATEERGKRNYVNELTKVYTLHTGWLTDDESSRMHHLLNSTNVYLGNLNDGRIIPVVLTGNTTDYKTYKGNGNRLVDYTIEAEVAQYMTRK